MNWQLSPPDQTAVERLVRELKITPLVAQLLINRGISEPASARAFLKPDLNNLSDPSLLPGMKTGIERINQALRNKEKIVIYGDYDTDGITSIALLLNMFKFIGTDVEFYIPHRLEEGYSLNASAIEKIAKSGGKLLITVDCGITDCAEIAHARKLGLDVIITDHHEPLRDKDGLFILPEANAIINPKIMLNGPAELSGVGVAFKLAWAFTQQFSNDRKRSAEFQQFLTEAIALVVVGTITDVATLSGENRILTAYGIPLLKNISLPWLDALIEKGGINRRFLSPRDISFRIGPRLNASGRMGSAQLALDLLLSRSRRHAMEIAEQLEKNNQDRQKIEKRILDSVREKIEKEVDLKKDYVIVLADPSWHLGVIGIVAAKIAEEFYRPTILMALNGTSARGSARSIPSFHLYQALQHCQNILTKFGGHSYAAGVEIETKNLEKFRHTINKYARNQLKEKDFTPSLEIDAEVPFDQLTVETIKQIEQMAPFGEGNPEPILCSKNVMIAGEPRLCGTNDEHCTFVARQSGVANNHSHKIIAFRMGKKWEEILRLAGKPFQIAYAPEIDNWNNQSNVSLNLKDFKIE